MRRPACRGGGGGWRCGGSLCQEGEPCYRGESCVREAGATGCMRLRETVIAVAAGACDTGRELVFAGACGGWRRRRPLCPEREPCYRRDRCLREAGATGCTRFPQTVIT